MLMEMSKWIKIRLFGLRCTHNYMAISFIKTLIKKYLFQIYETVLF